MDKYIIGYGPSGMNRSEVCTGTDAHGKGMLFSIGKKEESERNESAQYNTLTDDDGKKSEKDWNK